MEISEIIKMARIAKGLTQEELGKLVGVQKSAVAKWETGRVSEIKRTTLGKIANILEIEPTELFDWEDKIKKDPVEAANKAADILLDPEVNILVNMYLNLDDGKKKQVRDYVAFIADRH